MDSERTFKCFNATLIHLRSDLVTVCSLINPFMKPQGPGRNHRTVCCRECATCVSEVRGNAREPRELGKASKELEQDAELSRTVLRGRVALVRPSAIDTARCPARCSAH